MIEERISYDKSDMTLLNRQVSYRTYETDMEGMAQRQIRYCEENNEKCKVLKKTKAFIMLATETEDFYTVYLYSKVK